MKLEKHWRYAIAAIIGAAFVHAAVKFIVWGQPYADLRTIDRFMIVLCSAAGMIVSVFTYYVWTDES